MTNPQSAIRNPGATKVLLDTDIGSDIDDALALAYLLSQPRCELLGVTTVSGRARPRAEMASAMCHHAGRPEVPVHAGCESPLLAEPRQKAAQQAAALGDRPRRRDFEPATAVEFLRRTIRANPGEVTLLAIGPMTNVATLFALDPEVPGLLGQLVLMCGRFFEGMGHEWNAVNDAHATAIVYGAGRRTAPPRHLSYGLDVTGRCRMPADECRRRFTAAVLEPVREFAEVWFAAGRERITFHDPLATACIFEPDLCRYRRGRVSVSLTEPTEAWTVFRPDDAGPHQVAREVDAERFFEHYFDVVG
jgi:inosine-uridine nucleoside N-ribohydrolase